MKKLPKIIIGIAIFLVIIFFLAGVGIAVFGKQIVLSQIEKNLKKKATLGNINISLPLAASIRKLDIQGLVKIDSLYIRPSLLGLLAGKILLSEVSLVRPEIILEMDEQGKLNFMLPAGGKPPPVLVTGLDIKEGRFIFVDRKIDPAGYKVVINKLNVSIHKASFPPTSLLTRFSLSASLGDKPDTSAGVASAFGWIDFGPKDMEGKLELKEIDLTQLAPYYRKFIADKNLTSGKLSFVSDLKAEKNDLTAKCKAEVTNLVYAKREPAEGEEQKVDVLPEVLNLFSNDSGKIAFDFTIRTKLDNPSINPKELRGILGMAALQNIANQSPEKLKGNFKDMEKQFKDVGKAFKEMFRKKEE